MTATGDSCLALDTAALLPAAWRAMLAEGPVRMFNPGLLRHGEGWLLAYRVVGTDGRRRIALSQLDARLRIVAGSQVALTDAVRFRTDRAYTPVAREWFADPRLYRLGGRLFVYWNSGWHEPHNSQFLQELEPRTLAPLGPPRELTLAGPRQKLEKNWTFFEAEGGAIHAIYSILPQRVLACSLAGDDDIRCEEIARHDWTLPEYPSCHGGLRGGAPPVRVEDEYWSFCHSVHDAPEGYRYAAAVYRFAARAPFAPTAGPTRPLELGVSLRGTRLYPRLNPAVGEVIYPCGAARDGARWLVSHGINDEQCALSVLTPEEVAAPLQPVCRPGA